MTKFDLMFLFGHMMDGQNFLADDVVKAQAERYVVSKRGYGPTHAQSFRDGVAYAIKSIKEGRGYVT